MTLLINVCQQITHDKELNKDSLDTVPEEPE
jgi:hypothetical protein